jgi:hypothetical protein
VRYTKHGEVQCAVTAVCGAGGGTIGRESRSIVIASLIDSATGTLVDGRDLAKRGRDGALLPRVANLGLRFPCCWTVSSLFRFVGYGLRGA